MLKVNLFDSAFSHTKEMIGVITSTYIYPPKDIGWVEKRMVYSGITVFTDSFLVDPIVDKVKSTLKVAWLIEPPEIHPWTYEKIVEIEDKFDYILTFHPELLKRGPKYIKYIMGQSRVPDDITNFYEKSKHISMISSGKAISSGHRYRGEIANALASKHNIDLWGYAFKPFQEKTEPLIDYEFNIAIMNSKLDNYFTEILVDCFRLGTIPIFWGCPNIGEYFDVSGMETFDTIEDLDNVLINLKPYKEYIRGAKENFYQAKKYLNTDDYIANILKKL
jgi:hypothetical protein